MKIIRWGGALLLGTFTAVALATPAAAQDDPAFAHGEPGFTAAAGDDCGQVEITFTNPTPWLAVFDVRVDGEPALHEPVAAGVEIAEGPLAGQMFGDRWTLVEVDGQADVHEVTQTFTFAESVEVRLAEGAEQKLYFDWLPIDVEGLQCPPASPSPTPASPDPTPDPTSSPSPSTEVSAPASTPTGSEPAAGVAGGGDELPVTGSSLPLLLLAGALLVGVGSGGILLARRRAPKFTA